MSSPQRLGLYSLGIVLGALVGAAVPLFGEGRTRVTAFLAFAAGIMLGAAFFHMLPEALHGGGYAALSVVPVGFGFLFLLERYVLVHACEEPPDCAEHGHGNALGLAAFLGLSVHTLFDGIALGSSVMEGVGFSTFVAIAAHKLPSSLSLAAIFRSEGKPRPQILAYALLFGLMVPLGAGLYLVLRSVLPFETFSDKALAFSAGTFLYIAVSDLLPHVNRHGRDRRLMHVLTFGGGLGLMFALTLLTGHEH